MDSDPKRLLTNRHLSAASLVFRSGVMVGTRVALRQNGGFVDDWLPPHYALSIQQSLAQHLQKVRPAILISVCGT